MTYDPTYQVDPAKAEGKITWIVDNIIRERDYETGFPSLADAAREAGHKVIETSYRPFIDSGPYGLQENTDIVYPKSFDRDAPILVHGSHEFIKAARKTPFLQRMCPLAYCREDNLKFSTYAAYHGDDMLSTHYQIVPYAEMERRIHRHSYDWFVRPNDVTKIFAGRVIKRYGFEHELNSLNKIERVAPETLCVMAAPREIKAEFRFVIADGEVITGSEYRWDGRLDIRLDVDAGCLAMAEKVAKHDWQPDRVYVCDVALEETGTGPPRPRIIELNSFSCAGLYACDTRKIVEAVSRTACKEYYGIE